MKKLITTITLLCLSVAANADIYFCEATIRTLLGEFGGYVRESDGTQFLVDADKGVRWDFVQIYEGVCQQGNGYVSAEGVNCSYMAAGGLTRQIFINNETLKFSAAEHGLGANVTGWVGRCTKA